MFTVFNNVSLLVGITVLTGLRKYGQEKNVKNFIVKFLFDGIVYNLLQSLPSNEAMAE